MSSLQEMSARALARGSAYPALEWEKRWVNWEQMRQVADSVTRLLQASGADPLAPVALLPRNRPAVIAALLGVIAAGRSIRMIHVYQTPAGIARDIVKLKPAAVLGTTEDFTEELQAALREHGIAGITLTGMEATLSPGCERSTIVCDPYPSSPQIDLLTSGTTGPPKQFALSYDMLAEHMVGVNLMGTAQITDPATLSPIFMYLSFSTITGLYLTLPTMIHGLRGVLVDRFTLPGWHDYVLRHRPPSAGLPIPAIQMILEADIPPADLASLRWINTGAAPLDPSVQRSFEERYGIPILLAYGATEFAGPVAFMTMDLHREWGKQKFGSVGRPFAGAQLRIVDPETGAVLLPGEEGLLEVTTPRLGSGWIRTSDIGVIDADGFLYIRGRADGAINRGGFKLLPDTIEQALMLHDAVAAAVVTGIPDKRVGQVPAAAIRLKPGATQPTTEELTTHLRQHVPATHIPVEWRFVEMLPYTAMLKVDRVALRKLFETV